jgi:hypothetical protein
MKTRTLVSLVILVGALPHAAAAKGWQPPATLKVKWPAIFQHKDMAVTRVAEADGFICARAKSGKMHYVYVAMGTPKGIKADSAAAYGKKKGKFEVLDADVGEARLKRGGSISWISFSIRAMRTTTIIKAGKPKSEVFYELEIPPTSFPTEGDWSKLCNEAKAMMEAGAK